MKSYVATRLGLFGRINEFYMLYLQHSENIAETVSGKLEKAGESRAKIRNLIGTSVTGLKILEIGPGQRLIDLAYFDTDNDAVGIDLDIIPQYLNMRGTLRMVARNGSVRTAKTLVRKMLRIDINLRRELASQLRVREIPELRVIQMDAEKMSFPDDHFDVVYSTDVFEHLSDPAAVLSEIRRVLKPGGVMFVRLHLFTSDSGCHDTRIFVGRRGELPFWAHLRPEYERLVRSNTYLNKLRLADWTRIFTAKLPGCEVVPLCDAANEDRDELSRLRSRGELAEYSDVELLTPTVEASWRKPSSDIDQIGSRSKSRPWSDASPAAPLQIRHEL